MQTTDGKEVVAEIGRHLPFALCGYRVKKVKCMQNLSYTITNSIQKYT